jgi:hypothetical protein
MRRIAMNPKMVGGILLCAIFFSLSFVFSQDLEKEIRVQGMADITPGNVAGARDRAIEDALRKAVEEGVGIILNSETIAQDFRLIQDTILTNSKGYIKEYKIVHEGQRGWIYTVTIDAKIAQNLLKSDLETIRHIQERKGNPRVMIIIDENFEGIGKSAITENALIQKFLEKGFKIVDPKTVKKNIERDQLMRAIEGDDRTAALLGIQYGADMVIMGTTTTTSHTLKVSGVDLKSLSISLSVRVIRADTGEVLIGKTETAMEPQATSIGRQMAIEDVCEKLSNYLIPKIIQIWNEELANLNSISLTVTGLESYDMVPEIKQFLQSNIRNLKKIYDRGFVQNTVRMDLIIRGGSAKNLAEDLSTKKGPSYAFQVKILEANSLTVAIIPVDSKIVWKTPPVTGEKKEEAIDEGRKTPQVSTQLKLESLPLHEETRYEEPRVEDSKKEEPKVEEPKPIEVKKPKKYVRVKINSMNVREFPGQEFRKLGSVSKGDKFPLISTVHPKSGATWHEIDFEGKRAFIWDGGVEIIELQE